MRKLIAVFTLALASVAFAPRPAAAQEADCTYDYVQCLNDSYELKGALQTMADIECFADYLACTASALIV